MKANVLGVANLVLTLQLMVVAIYPVILYHFNDSIKQHCQTLFIRKRVKVITDKNSVFSYNAFVGLDTVRQQLPNTKS